MDDLVKRLREGDGHDWGVSLNTRCQAARAIEAAQSRIADLSERLATRDALRLYREQLCLRLHDKNLAAQAEIATLRAELAAAREALDAANYENGTLKAIVQGWHYLAVGPDEMGDYYTHKQLVKASEPYASPALRKIKENGHDAG